MELETRTPLFNELESIIHMALIGVDIDGPFGNLKVKPDVSKKVLNDVFNRLVFLVENFEDLSKIVEAE